MNQLSQFISNHWPLCAAFVVLLLLVLVNELLSLKNKAKSISPQGAVDLMNNEQAVIIDIRDKEAFKKGHIIDALNINTNDLDAQKLQSYKEKPIIIVCARGQQASPTATKIRALGFNTLALNGGMMAWYDAQLPVVKK